MPSMKTGAAIILVCSLLLLAGTVPAQVTKLTEIARSEMKTGQEFAYKADAPNHHGTYYWIQLSTVPEGLRAMVKIYSQGKEIDAFSVSNTEVRMFNLKEGFVVRYIEGAASTLRLSIYKSPYEVGPGGH